MADEEIKRLVLDQFAKLGDDGKDLLLEIKYNGDAFWKKISNNSIRVDELKEVIANSIGLFPFVGVGTGDSKKRIAAAAWIMVCRLEGSLPTPPEPCATSLEALKEAVLRAHQRTNHATGGLTEQGDI